MKKKSMKSIIVVAIFVLLLLGELFARFVLGLGDPPLSIGDKEIDYLFAPNQECNRFGNSIVYNDFSMRCDFTLKGTNPKRRIFVVGDSVVNGGVLTDHKDLATTILQNTGMNAYTKSDATDIAIDAIETVVVSFTRITVEMRIAVAVE